MRCFRHMTLKHSDVLEASHNPDFSRYSNLHALLVASQSNASTCLADLCPIFGCSTEDVKYTKRGRKKKSQAVEGGFAGIVTCTDKDVEKVRFKCEALSRRSVGTYKQYDLCVVQRDVVMYLNEDYINVL